MTPPEAHPTPRIFVVRAGNGAYADAFKQGGYVAVGLLQDDLGKVTHPDEIYEKYEAANPSASASLVGNHVGQIKRFLFDLKPGNHVLTPAEGSELVKHGVVLDEEYTYGSGQDACPYPHRRTVKWNSAPLRRSTFSIPLQNTMRSLLTVFRISETSELFSMLGLNNLLGPAEKKALDMHEAVIERILSKDADFFEQLVVALLAAMGFESKHTGRTGDGGVDAQGVLDVGGMVRVELKVQAKRYKAGNKINGGTIRSFRGSIPDKAQGAFVTTADYSSAAQAAATEEGFKRVGLVNGRQLVDLLTENWGKLRPELRDELGLRPGLFPA